MTIRTSLPINPVSPSTPATAAPYTHGSLTSLESRVSEIAYGTLPSSDHSSRVLTLRSLEVLSDVSCSSADSALSHFPIHPVEAFSTNSAILPATESSYDLVPSSDVEYESLSIVEPTTPDRALPAPSKRSASVLRSIFKHCVDKAQIIGKGTTCTKYASPKLLEERAWQEALLPSHPFSISINEHFNVWRLDKAAPSSFEKYLRDQRVLETISTVTYLSEEERKNYQVEFRDGLLYSHDKPLSTSENTTLYGSGLAIYVVGTDKKMYVGSQTPGSFHHSSFCSGSSLIGAGEIVTSPEGRILEINNLSGHYMPSRKDLLTSLRYLKDQGIDLSTVKLTEAHLVSDVGSRKSMTCPYTNALAYLESEGKTAPSSIHITEGNDSKPGFSTGQIDALKTLQKEGRSLLGVSIIRSTPEKCTTTYSAEELITTSGMSSPHIVEIELAASQTAPSPEQKRSLIALSCIGHRLDSISLVEKKADDTFKTHVSVASYLASLPT